MSNLKMEEWGLEISMYILYLNQVSQPSERRMRQYTQSIVLLKHQIKWNGKLQMPTSMIPFAIPVTHKIKIGREKSIIDRNLTTNGWNDLFVRDFLLVFKEFVECFGSERHIVSSHEPTQGGGGCNWSLHIPTYIPKACY